MRVCFITGILSATELYFFHQVIPNWQSVADPNTHYLDVKKVAEGAMLFTVFSITMSVSQSGAGFAAQVSAARLVYGMGRNNVPPCSRGSAVAVEGMNRKQHPGPSS